MENWEWPQYFLVGWWTGFFFMAVGASIVTRGNRGISKAWPYYFNILVLCWILYMGGFWS